MSWKDEIPSDLVGNVNNLMDIKSINFRDIDKDKIEALSYNSSYSDMDFNWVRMDIFTNPMVFYNRDFKPLNPGKSSIFLETRLFTPSQVSIYRTTGKKFLVPSIRERFSGLKTQSSVIHRAFYDVGGSNQETFSENSKVIPIYEGNSDYAKIMEYINLNREAGK